MKEKELLKQLSTKGNGQFFFMSWSREMKLLASATERYTVLKVVKAQVRKGIRNSHTKAYKKKQLQHKVKSMINEYLASETEKSNIGSTPELPWGNWKNSNLLIEHTDKKGKYNVYLRLYSVNKGKNAINKSKTWYILVDNITHTAEEISKEELYNMNILTATEKRENIIEDDGLFNINIEHIERIY